MRDEMIVVGVDCSMGLHDNCVAQFLSKGELDIPIVFRSKCIASEMTNKLFPILDEIADKTRRKPLVAFERNNGGIFEMERLAHLNRGNKFKIFQMKKHGEADNDEPETVKLGWDCVTPNSLILTSNLQWVKASSLKVGDGIIGPTETPVRNKKKRGYFHRYLINQKILNIKNFEAPIIKVELSNGTILRVSNNHPFLVKTYTNGSQWKRADKITLKDIVYTIPIWESLKTFEAGRLSGLLCGEGYIQNQVKQNNRRYGLNLMVAQSEGLLADEIEQLWDKVGFKPNRKYIRHQAPERSHHKTMTYIGVGKILTVLEALGKLRPTRLINKFETKNLIETITDRNLPRISIKDIIIEPIGKVIGIETSGHTLIVDGVLSHNTNAATRPAMLIALKECIDNRLIRIYDRTTIDELFTFVKVQTSTIVKAQAEKNCLDDCVMALAITWQLYLDIQSETDEVTVAAEMQKYKSHIMQQYGKT